MCISSLSFYHVCNITFMASWNKLGRGVTVKPTSFILLNPIPICVVNIYPAANLKINVLLWSCVTLYILQCKFLLDKYMYSFEH